MNKQHHQPLAAFLAYALEQQGRLPRNTGSSDLRGLFGGAYISAAVAVALALLTLALMYQ